MTTPPRPGRDRARHPRPVPRPERGRVLARPAGTPIVVTSSWYLVNLAVLALTTVLLVRVTGTGPDVRHAVAALAWWGSLQVGVVLHEFAHGRTARRAGNPPLRYAFTGRGAFTAVDATRETPPAALRTAAAGPAVNLALGVFLGGLAAALAPLADRVPTTPAQFVAWPVHLAPLPPGAEVVGVLGWALAVGGVVNLVLGGSNLVPAAPLDGGAILEALVWRTTGRRAAGRRAAAVGGIVLASLAALALLGALVARILPALLALPALVALAAVVATNLELARRPHRAPDPPQVGPQARVARDSQP